MDSCYSGSARLGKGPDDTAVLATQLISKGGGVQEEGKCILAASQSYQEAYGTQEGEHSIFTHYLIKGLDGDREAVDNKGNITPDTLGRYVYDKVTSTCPNQKPIRKLESSGDIILATFPEMVEESSGVQVGFNINSTFKEASTLLTIGEYTEALSHYNKILQDDPQNTQAWNGKGVTLEKLIMYDEAIGCFNRAIKNGPNDYIAWYNKGNVLAKLVRFEDSLRCYDTAIQINPGDQSCWKNKAYVLSKLGRGAEAKKCMVTATNLGNKSHL